jgi:hypothetical protein
VIIYRAFIESDLEVARIRCSGTSTARASRSMLGGTASQPCLKTGTRALNRFVGELLGVFGVHGLKTAGDRHILADHPSDVDYGGEAHAPVAAVADPDSQPYGRESHLFSSLLVGILYSRIGTCCAFITSSSASTVGGDGLKLPKR